MSRRPVALIDVSSGVDFTTDVELPLSCCCPLVSVALRLCESTLSGEIRSTRTRTSDWLSCRACVLLSGVTDRGSLELASFSSCESENNGSLFDFGFLALPVKGSGCFRLRLSECFLGETRSVGFAGLLVLGTPLGWISGLSLGPEDCLFVSQLSVVEAEEYTPPFTELVRLRMTGTRLSSADERAQ